MSRGGGPWVDAATVPEVAPFRVRLADSQAAMTELHAIRDAIFVREQHVPTGLERDNLDAACVHVVARTLADEAIGTGRLLPPTSPGQPAKIGRMAVLADWRGHGVGAAMLLSLLRIARQRGWYDIALNAQASAIDFYLRHDFIPQGPRFIEAGIEHQAMHRTLAGPSTVSTSDAAVSTAVAIVLAARRAVYVLGRDLDARLFDAPELVQAFRSFATSGNGAQAKLLLQDTATPQRTQAPLLALAQRLPSAFLFREIVDPVDRGFASAFMANDAGGFYFRAQAARLDGETDLNAPGRARQLRATFEQKWERARPVTEYRDLAI
ncbi:MAG: GNAT family N-acetyltransferase [Luteimonas sp.]